MEKLQSLPQGLWIQDQAWQVGALLATGSRIGISMSLVLHSFFVPGWAWGTTLQHEFIFFINESWTRLLENLGQPVTCHLHLAEPRCRKGVFNGAAERELQKHCRPCLFYLQCRLMLSLVQYGLIYPAHCEMHFFFLDVDAELRRNEGISRVSQTRGLMPAGISHIFKWVLQSRCSSRGYNSQKWGAAGKITQSCDHTLWLLWILFFHEIIQDPQMT